MSEDQPLDIRNIINQAFEEIDLPEVPLYSFFPDLILDAVNRTRNQRLQQRYFQLYGMVTKQEIPVSWRSGVEEGGTLAEKIRVMIHHWAGEDKSGKYIEGDILRIIIDGSIIGILGSPDDRELVLERIGEILPELDKKHKELVESGRFIPWDQTHRY